MMLFMFLKKCNSKLLFSPIQKMMNFPYYFIEVVLKVENIFYGAFLKYEFIYIMHYIKILRSVALSLINQYLHSNRLCRFSHK